MFLDPLVRKQRWQLLGRDDWYPLEDILKMHEWINAMTVTSLGQCEQLSGCFTGGRVGEEEPSLASKNRILDRPFRSIVIHRDGARLSKDLERIPAIERIVDRVHQPRLGQLTFLCSSQ